MALTSEQPLWLLKSWLVRTYPALDQDLICDIAILGAGMAGAMLDQRLTESVFSVVLLDRGDVCRGSTAASTAVLQYEIAVTLAEMSELIGWDKASRAYQISHRSIDRLTSLIEQMNIDCEFRRTTRIFLADDRPTAKLLAQEASARRANRLDVSFHDQKSWWIRARAK